MTACLLSHDAQRSWCPYCPSFFAAALAATRKSLESRGRITPPLTAMAGAEET